MNRHQPNKKLLTIRRGEGGEERQGGPLWAPASWALFSPAGLFQPKGGRYVLHPGGTREGEAVGFAWAGGDPATSPTPTPPSIHHHNTPARPHPRPTIRPLPSPPTPPPPLWIVPIHS